MQTAIQRRAGGEVMTERDLELPPMDVPEAVELIDGRPYGGYYPDYPFGCLAAYDEPVSETLQLAHAVARRLLGSSR